MSAPRLDIADLPETLPLLPLPRTILLPRVQIPLNIAEPRTAALTRNALATPGRLIGLVQKTSDGAPDVTTGCAGRIMSFNETDDGRYLVTLNGVCRFRIAQDLPADPAGFRRVRPDWAPFHADMTPEEAPSGLCRDSLMQTLRAYFDRQGLFCDQWETIKDVSCEKLVSTLSVVCPLEPEEKQALLEAATPADRALLLQSILQNTLSSDHLCTTRH